MTAPDVYRDIAHFIDRWTPGLPAVVGLRMVRSYCEQMSRPDKYEPLSEAEVKAYIEDIREDAA